MTWERLGYPSVVALYVALVSLLHTGKARQTLIGKPSLAHTRNLA